MVQNYSFTELELFGLVINIYAFRQLLTNVYFEVFCDHSAIAQILNRKKKLPTHKIQRLIEHLLPFNFTVHYLPGEKMHIGDILSRLGGKDLEPSDQLIPISFNVHTKRSGLPTEPLKLYMTDKHKSAAHSAIQTQSVIKLVQSKTKALQPHIQKVTQLLKIQTHVPKPSTSTKLPPVPIGVLWKSPPWTLPAPQEGVRKS